MIPLARLLPAAAALSVLATPAAARERRDGGKLLLTGGVSSVEGAAGGGLASWAVIGGNETEDGIGGSAHATYVALPDFDLTSYGAAIGWRDRVELTYAHQSFDTRSAGAALGLGRGFTFAQDVFGAKVRVLGDAVWDQDSILPQIAIGVQHKRADKATIIHAVGGKESRGTDFYASATKVILSRSIVLDATVRFTKANQFGLLGFGGDRQANRAAQFEGSAGMLVTRKLLVGGEYRTKPDNLGFAKEDDSYDLFAAWAVGRRVAVTAAYTALGSIATFKRQNGLFASIQGSF
ncbi:conserved exported hypothetical protein [Sphingomonas sp. EC-HK361]|uniref:DUF3034 family protein n=1 Tax=Sphingomonas sp. EC-HK361 TaxID=2038397 RepID=UPI00125C8121|nr:DUF3034 family protein [Sphingomonas sp. EC-HK361]VVT00039.1 conserved exported hypothetical protein [Sphingomonas sp. EC-HK361]